MHRATARYALRASNLRKRMESLYSAERAIPVEHPAPSSGAASLLRRPLLSVDDTRATAETFNVKASVENLNFYYGGNQALKSLTIPIAEKQVTALIGPSGCGKSTFLRCFN